VVFPAPEKPTMDITLDIKTSAQRSERREGKEKGGAKPECIDNT
jgi:hypothetical protein